MLRLILSLIMSMTLCTSVGTDVLAQDADSVQDSVAVRAGVIIEETVAGLTEPPDLTPGGQRLHASEMLRRFYSRRNFQPAWMGMDSTFPYAETMLEVINDVEGEGLSPDYYHRRLIQDLITRIRTGALLNPEVVAELDLLLTDAYLIIGCHYSAGCPDPVTIQSEWFVNRNDLAVDSILEDALTEGTIKDSLLDLLPVHSHYYRLRQRLNHLKDTIASGGWQALPLDLKLKRGSKGPFVAILKKRLMLSDDLIYAESESDSFDDDLKKAVIRFQKRHGLQPDGVVGKNTLGALNIPPEQRLRQIEVNLERMRWTSRNLGHRYILVNIADYRLSVVEQGEVTMDMNVVVGMPFWNTPVFSKKMRYIVLNPFWNIPESIAVDEVLPKIKNDPEYLAIQGIRIFRNWARDAEEIDSASIDWKTLEINKFRYVLRQYPGPLNPLGKVKFMMPNKYNIYLHDSPAKGLFARNSRAFSHGCIRVKHPLDLASYLLREDSEWSRKKIEAAIQKGEEVRINLPRPINVHIVYLTAWVDEQDRLQFRNDIYGRDEFLDKALRKKPSNLSAYIRQ